MINDENRKDFNSISGVNGIPFIYVPFSQSELVNDLRCLCEARFDQYAGNIEPEISSGHVASQRPMVFTENRRTGREI